MLRMIAPPTRGDRYRMRSAETGTAMPVPTSFAELAAIPGWLNWPEQEQQSLAIMAAILASAEAIERELSGEKLRALAMAIGTELFNYAAEHYFEAALQLTEVADPIAKLPRPEDLEALGQQILSRALPVALQARFSDAANDPSCRAITALACDVLASFNNLAAEPPGQDQLA